ncbi:MAG: ubiquinone/menaquinone biosynthesis methyltransferase [Actinobacteria bacterium]|nr:ubiquinone/menaquinone biosynthesis methyltransferase [Actinomycetota bacterium]
MEALFDDIVGRYDRVNTILSFGLDRAWRRTAARALGSPLGTLVLDLGCGTGALGLQLAATHRVVGVDVSHGMLTAAVSKATNPGRRMRLVRGTALRLPFRSGAFQGAVSAFLLRNLDDLPGAFDELARVVAPAGSVALLDITGPRHPVLRRAFDAYFGAAAPALGALTGSPNAYRYLVRSLAQLPAPEGVCAMLREAGFSDTRARGLTGGVVTLFTATRGPSRRT